MKLSTAFPSNYLKSEDLQGREVTLTISRYAMDKVGDEQKLVINFAGKEKGMICNRTNADRIAHYYGDDLDNWIGKSIILGTELVSYQGKTTEGLRVKGRPVEGQAPQPLQPTNAAAGGAPFDETIPF